MLQRQKTASSCSALAERAEIGNAEFGYVARDISKQNIKDAAFCFFYFLFFFLVSKIQEGRNTLKKDILSKKEPVFQDLEASRPIQISKDANI